MRNDRPSEAMHGLASRYDTGSPVVSQASTVSGTLTNPGIGRLDASDPLLKFVDLSTVHISEAQKLALPAWARRIAASISLVVVLPTEPVTPMTSRSKRLRQAAAARVA